MYQLATGAWLVNCPRSHFCYNHGFAVYAYVILENHQHCVVQSNQLDVVLAHYKFYVAKQLIAYLNDNKVSLVLEQLAFYKKALKKDRAYQFWQEGYHPELIKNDEMMRKKLIIFITILSSAVC